MPAIAVARGAGPGDRRKSRRFVSGEVSMIMGTSIGDPRPASTGRSISCAALLAAGVIFAASAGNANELAGPNSARAADGGSGIAATLNRQQLSLAAVRSDVPTSGAAVETVGVLFLRSDGGDPKELRVDDGKNL